MMPIGANQAFSDGRAKGPVPRVATNTPRLQAVVSRPGSVWGRGTSCGPVDHSRGAKKRLARPFSLPRRLRFHDLRHATATLMLEAGVSLAAVQRVMRHTDPKVTTEIYGHLADDHVATEIVKLRLAPLPDLPDTTA